MSRVITFSRTFPAYHPKAGQPTYFVEKIWNSIETNDYAMSVEKLQNLNPKSDVNVWAFWNQIKSGYNNDGAKHHTIRAGNRWKAGDKFSPRVWSGKPYNSKQIIIAPDIEIVKVWRFEIKNESDTVNNGTVNNVYVDGQIIGNVLLKAIAENDGLSLVDLMDWFKMGENKACNFTGQIISWARKVNY